MAIRNVIINTTDVAESVAFYRRFLRAEPVGEVTDEHAVLDLVTATFEFFRVTDAVASNWSSDDLVTGFRHIGFKVARVDPMAEELKAAGVPFHLDPLDATGDVRITFFFAPEGTLLELVEGDLAYTVVRNAAGVARERALGVPTRPRFDHIALTVTDEERTEACYAPFGFTPIGTIEQPHDPRGFHLNFLKSGETVLEVFTYDVPKQLRTPQTDAPGFVAAVIDSVMDGSAVLVSTVGTAPRGEPVVADSDGFTFILAKDEAVA